MLVALARTWWISLFLLAADPLEVFDERQRVCLASPLFLK